jgi:hypothetical protein
MKMVIPFTVNVQTKVEVRTSFQNASRGPPATWPSLFTSN